MLILFRKTLLILTGFYLEMRLLHEGLFCKVTPWEEEHILIQWDSHINLTRSIGHLLHKVGLAPGGVLQGGFTTQGQVVGQGQARMEMVEWPGELHILGVGTVLG